MSWEDALAAHLAAQGHGEVGRSILIGPPLDDDLTDDACFGLVSRPGPVDETYGALYGRPNLSLVYRTAPNATDGLAKITAAYADLARVANTVIQGVTFLRIEPTAWPGFLRLDSKRRRDYTGDLNVWLDEA